MCRKSLPAALVLLSMSICGTPVLAAEIPAYPNEQEARLVTVDDEVLKAQRALSQARRRGDTDKLADLQQRSRELREERRQLQHSLRLDW